MDFMQEYEKWLHSPALSPEEHAELESIKDDPRRLKADSSAAGVWHRRSPGHYVHRVYIT